MSLNTQPELGKGLLPDNLLSNLDRKFPHAGSAEFLHDPWLRRVIEKRIG